MFQKGSASGKINEEHTYAAFTTDPNGDEIYSFFDWGNGEFSGWIAVYDTGEIAETNHTWIFGKSSVFVPVVTINTLAIVIRKILLIFFLSFSFTGAIHTKNGLVFQEKIGGNYVLKHLACTKSKVLTDGLVRKGVIRQ